MNLDKLKIYLYMIDYEIKKIKVKPGSKIKQYIAPGGGFAMSIIAE